MSRIYVDEVIASGVTQVTFPQGIKIAPTKTIDLSGAAINLTAGVGLDGQVLCATGGGLTWGNRDNTDTTYTFGGRGLAVNDVKIDLTAGGSGSGTQTITFAGQNAATVTYDSASRLVRISATDTNTTYGVSAVDGTTGKKIIRLTGSDSTTDDVTLVAGSNIDLSRSGDEITISTVLSGTVSGPISSTNTAIVLFDGTAGNLLKNSSVTVTASGAIVTTSGVGNLLPFYYSTQATFPNPTQYKGAIAYSDNGGNLFYATNAQWIQLAKLSDIQLNTDTTYSVAAQDITSNVKRIRLSDSNGLTDDIEFETTGSISLTRSGERLVFAGRTYNISSQTGTGNTVRFRLGDSDGGTDDVIFAGADGLLVERTDENTVTFRSPTLSGITSYTDAQARSAVAQALINGTSVGIDFTYDVNSQTINSIVTASGVGGGGGGVLYDFYGSNTTSNQVILNLDPSDGITDSVEFAGAGGTTISWDSINNKATIQSTAPVNADWNATTGLAQILNKPVIPPAYVLPTATTSVLGGVRVDGTTITVTASGILSATPGAYVLPAATPTTLGGIKIGAGLSIDGNGVVNVTASGIGGGLVTRQELAGTTSSLADNTTTELNIDGYKSYTLLKIQTSAAAWVRVYTDDASRDADVTRSEGQDPVAGSGVITEVRTTGAQTVLITPGVIGFNNDTVPNTNIYLSVTNRSGSTTPITVTLTAIRLEA
jgi:hypothetical protein